MALGKLSCPSWVRVRVALVGALEVIYIVSGDHPSGLDLGRMQTQMDRKGKGKAVVSDDIPVLVPVSTGCRKAEHFEKLRTYTSWVCGYGMSSIPDHMS